MESKADRKRAAMATSPNDMQNARHAGHLTPSILKVKQRTRRTWNSLLSGHHGQTEQNTWMPFCIFALTLRHVEREPYTPHYL